MIVKRQLSLHLPVPLKRRWSSILSGLKTQAISLNQSGKSLTHMTKSWRSTWPKMTEDLSSLRKTVRLACRSKLQHQPRTLEKLKESGNQMVFTLPWSLRLNLCLIGLTRHVAPCEQSLWREILPKKNGSTTRKTWMGSTLTSPREISSEARLSREFQKGRQSRKICGTAWLAHQEETQATGVPAWLHLKTKTEESHRL